MKGAAVHPAAAPIALRSVEYLAVPGTEMTARQMAAELPAADDGLSAG